MVLTYVRTIWDPINNMEGVPNTLSSLNKTIIAVPFVELSKYLEYIENVQPYQHNA